MTIGIDLTTLQTPHRLRGIGATLINFMNNITVENKKNHFFIFYVLDNCKVDPLELIDIKNFNFEVRKIQNSIETSQEKSSRKKIFRILLKIKKIPLKIRVANSFLFGDKRYDIRQVDQFVSFDQNQSFPPKNKVSTTLIVYDIIPYILEQDYLWKYRTARLKGRTRKRSFLLQLDRWIYKKKLKLNIRNAENIISISESTKTDIIKELGIKKEITVCHLGINNPSTQNLDSTMNYYVNSCWGRIKHSKDFKNESYLLFIGGADPRRKIEDLIAAFNNLKARNHNIKLLLAGDTMFGPNEIPNSDVQRYLKSTSYMKDIYFLGFINDAQKNWLYKNTIAFVYPSIYEGFGLPVLEAMSYGTPVITYRNSSIAEIAGDSAIYAKNYLDIMNESIKLILEKTYADKYSEKGLNTAKKYSWSKTTNNMFSIIGDKNV